MRSSATEFILFLVFAVTPGLAQTPAWYQVPWGELHPPARDYPAMAYDEQRQQVVLFGGYSQASNSWLQDTWIWDGRYWKQKSPSVSPQKLFSPSMAYDAYRDRVVLFGAEFSFSGWTPHTWLWDGSTASWVEVSPSTQPEKWGDVAIVYDEIQRHVLLFTGCYSDGQPSNDLWIWNGVTWTKNPQPTGAQWPPSRCHPKMAYDRQRGQVVLFGGWDGGSSWMSDTWVWNGAAWTPKVPANSPPPDGSYPLAADNNRNVVLALGPLERPSTTNTWSWNGTDWTKMITAASPTSSRLTLSETAGGVLAVGGSIVSGFDPAMADSWVWGVIPVIFNKSPVASAGMSQTVPCTNAAGAAVNLDASASYDPDGDPLTYTWNGPFGAAQGVRPTVLLPIGLSTVVLSVSDGKATAQASVQVSVTVAVKGLAPPMGPLTLYPDLPPLPDSAIQGGRTLPLKLNLSCAGQTVFPSTSPVIAGVVPVGGTSPLPTIDPGPVSDRDTGVQFRQAGDGWWIFNLGTADMAPGLYLVSVRMPDSRIYRFAIALR